MVRNSLLNMISTGVKYNCPGRPRKKDAVKNNEGKRMKQAIISLNEDIHAYLAFRAGVFGTSKKAYVEQLVLHDFDAHFEEWNEYEVERKRTLERSGYRI